MSNHRGFDKRNTKNHKIRLAAVFNRVKISNIVKILFGYVDPGLGALAWQTTISAFVGGLFYLKRTRRWIVSIFQRLFHLK